jgi:small conductance mechanosensitive channel
MKEQFFKVMQKYVEDFWMILPKIVIAFVVLIIAVVIAHRIKRMVQNRTERRLDDPLLAKFLATLSKWTVIAIGSAMALHVVELGGISRGIFATAGLSGIVLGFAFRDIGENFLAGVLLAFNRPFSIGDTIETNDIKGIIKNLDLRNTRIRSFDGKDIYVPNAMIIKSPLLNSTRDGLLRFDFTVGIDYSNDIHRARKLILKTLASKPGVLKDPGPLVMVEELADNRVNLRAYYWVNIFKYKESTVELKNDIMNQTKEELLDSGFKFTADIVELKIHQKEQPIPLKLIDSVLRE